MSYRLLLRAQPLHTADLPLSNCTIYCKGPTTPSPLRLRVLATRAGARCVFKMSSAVTHVILDPVRTPQWNIDDAGIHVVHPRWIIDCFNSNKRLDERNYFATDSHSQQRLVEGAQFETTNRDESPDAYFESAAVTRLQAIETLLNEKLPSSPEEFLNKADYYQCTREGRMRVAKSLLQWRFLHPRSRLMSGSFIGGPSIKYKNVGVTNTYRATPIVCKKQHFDQQMSAWKLEMTDYLLTHPPTGPTPIHSKNMYVLCHVYVDAFFISSSLSFLSSNERTRLIGVSVIIANQFDSKQANDGAIILDCTKAAKQMGIESGMTVGEAFERCPTTQVLSYDTKMYNTKGQELFKVLGQFSKAIMPMNYNEAVLDLSGHVSLSAANGNSCLALGLQLQQRVLQETGLHCSLGFGDSLFAAQIATKLAGSNGIFSATSSTCRKMLINRPLSFLPGLSSEVEQQFAEQLGITKCGEILSAQIGDICQIISVDQAKQLISILKGRTDDASKGFFPVRTEGLQPRARKLFLNTLESKQIHKKSTETLSSKALRRLSVLTRPLSGQVHSLQDDISLDKSVSPLITELYLRMLRKNLSLTSETKLTITLQLKQSNPLANEIQNEPNTDHYSITATTELFNVTVSTTPKPDYHILKSAAKRCVKDLWSQVPKGLLSRANSCSTHQRPIKRSFGAKPSLHQQGAFDVLYEASSTLSHLLINTGVSNVADTSNHSSQTLSDSDTPGDAFKEQCESEAPLATDLPGHKGPACRSNESVRPLTHYTKAYSMPSRAYEHTCLFSTDVETRVKAYGDAVNLMLSRDISGESAETRKRLLQAALHSFVVQLCSDGDLEGVLYLSKRYQFTKETCDYVNMRFSNKIL